MPSLRYQLRELLPSLGAQAGKGWGWEVKRRWYLLKAVAESSKPVKRVCELRGCSREQFYKWGKKLLETKDLKSLESGSRKPKHSPNVTSKRTANKVKKLKRKYSFMGPERISFELKDCYKLKCPPSTVYAILRREGLISQKYKKHRTKKHMKRYRRSMPGYLQVDFKHVPFKVAGQKYYQLSAVDHCTTWRMIRVYGSPSIENTYEFLNELGQRCPFPILQIQTDNDVAFTDKFTSPEMQVTGRHWFDIWCNAKEIEHKLIPPGVKELNGKVENTHKQDDDEFFSQHWFESFQQLKTLTALREHYWNEHRATKALGWQTPNQLVYKHLMGWLIVALAIQDRLNEMELINQRAKKKRKEQRKRENQLNRGIDRYLAWMDWDASQYPKSIVAVSSMSRIFSCSLRRRK